MNRDEEGSVDVMILLITSRGCRGKADSEKSEMTTKYPKDYVADIVSKTPTRFQDFESVRMHDAAKQRRSYSRCPLVVCMLTVWTFVFPLIGNQGGLSEQL